jgi:membrane protein YdbS with pleckstrin-like domain
MSDGDRTGADTDTAADGVTAVEGAIDASGSDTGAGSEATGASSTDARNEAGTGDGSGVEEGSDVDLSAAPAPGDGLVALDPRVRLVWIVRAAVSAGVLGTLVGVTGLVLLEDSRPGVAVAVAAFVLGSVHALLRYRVWRYEVREASLYLERGVFTRVTTVVPYVRIQHVDASRGPIERLSGLATAVAYTAGSRGADVSIPGLTPEGARALQRRLERLAIAAESEDAV